MNKNILIIFTVLLLINAYLVYDYFNLDICFDTFYEETRSLYGEYIIYDYSEYNFDASKSLPFYNMIFLMSSNDVHRVTFWFHAFHIYYFQIIDNELVLESVENRDGDIICHEQCSGFMRIEEIFTRSRIYNELEQHYAH